MKKVMPKSMDELMRLIREAQEEGAEVKFINSETGEEGTESLLAALKKASGVEIEAGGEGNCPTCGEDHTKFHMTPGPEIAHALMDVVAVHAHPIQFKAGQFVRFRPEVQYVKRSRDLHVIVEVLPEPFRLPMTHEDSGSPYAYRVYDVLVAAMTKHGICKHLVDSRELEIFPDAEKFLGKNS